MVILAGRPIAAVTNFGTYRTRDGFVRAAAGKGSVIAPDSPL